MVSRLLKGVPAWLVATLAVVLMAGAAQASAATQPIEGTWNFQGGQINVQATGADTYVGTVVQPTAFVDNNCVHLAGTQIWQITGSGADYSGTHEWLKPPVANCASAGLGDAQWQITNTSPTQNTMAFCTAAPGSGEPGATNPKTRCFTLTQTVSATQEPSVPGSTGAPSISGTPSVGQSLTCSTGTWSNAPTGYSYAWERNGGPIAGATLSGYTVQTADEGDSVTCQVTAYNQGGSSQPATSAAVKVATGITPPGGRTKSGCPAATGKLSAKRLGSVRLGMTRARARHAYRKSHDRKSKFRDVFCLTPHGVAVGYTTTAIDKTLSKKAVRKLKNKVVWVTTSNPLYSIKGVHAGSKLKPARSHLKLGKPFRVHGRTWFLARYGSSTAVIKTAHGKIAEIGIANRSLTKSPLTRTALLKSLV